MLGILQVVEDEPHTLRKLIECCAKSRKRVVERHFVGNDGLIIWHSGAFTDVVCSSQYSTHNHQPHPSAMLEVAIEQH